MDQGDLRRRGPTLKRWFKPRARGRVGQHLTRTCHITVVVAEKGGREWDAKSTRSASGSALSSDWESKWFAERNYTEQLHEDLRSAS